MSNEYLVNKINVAYTKHITEMNLWLDRGRIKKVIDRIRGREEPNQAQLALDIADAIIKYMKGIKGRSTLRVTDFVQYFGNQQDFAMETLIAAGAIQTDPKNNNILHLI